MSERENNNNAGCGVGLGSLLAAILSFAKWHSIPWAVLHLFLGWLYVAYFIAAYGIEQWNLAPLLPAIRL